MAIRRCPYCKAIIDEGSEYCSNCGTQLLFPEDEYIDEEIPGEKIVNEETPEEDNPKGKKSSMRGRKKKDKPQELGSVDSEEKTEAGEEVVEHADGEEIAVDMPEMEKRDESENPLEPERDEFFVEAKEPAFGTEDLEKAIDPEEKEKAEIEKFLKSLKEDREEWDGEIPPTDELPPWAEKIKDEKPEEVQKSEEIEEVLPLGEEEAVQEGAVDEELSIEEFPPVEEEKEEEIEEEILKPMGLTPEDEVPDVQIPEEEASEEEASLEPVEEEKENAEPEDEELPKEEYPPMEEEKEEEIEEDVTPDDEASMPDTGMGLPEGVEQENLPFIDKSTGEIEDDEKSPPSRYVTWIKSRAFDVLFIAALWFVTLHIASRMLSTNLFKLISVSVLPVFALYLALLAVYLFLFFLFLGQTLGDHLFPYEE
jgi:hypothetical protein